MKKTVQLIAAIIMTAPFFSCKDSQDLRTETSAAHAINAVPTGAVLYPPATPIIQLPPTSPTTIASGTTIATPAPSAVEEPPSYPVLTFAGTGKLNVDHGPFNVQQDMNAQMNETTITITVTRFVGTGSHASDVTNGLKDQIGATTYTRVPKGELDNLAAADPSFKNANFLVFSKTAAKNNGGIVNFDRPIPVFVVPAPRTRYDPLVATPMSYNARATDGSGVEICNQMTISITALTTAATPFVAQIQSTCTSNDTGKVYSQLPMPYRAAYRVDTNNKVLCGLSAFLKFFSTKDKKDGDMTLEHQLVSSVLNGTAQPFSCN